MRVVWNGNGERRYQTGVDRGVLYLPGGGGVPWNGLTSVEEDTSDVEVEEFYFDGFKYLELRSSGDFSGTIKAFTFPVEFEQFDGLDIYDKGLTLDNQPVVDTFGLSYRTLIGNDLEGTSFGYKIHVLYNLTAKPDSRGFQSLSDQQNVNEFGWSISGIPEFAPGFKPTAHAIFDTTKMNRFLIKDLEDLLYGKDPVSTAPTELDVYDGGTPGYTSPDILDGGSVIPGADGSTTTPDTLPVLPPLADLMELVRKWVMIQVTDNGDGTWTATGPDELITMLDSTTFQIDGIPATFLDADTYQISTAHGF